ncbi:hypothetical protein O3P69_011810 [Scylla paramamosain]|uniref:Transposase n=1 Tax=Scylla paramamosain TaxID=85552 RepID=A0AAW0S9U8_SCYPA
MLNKLKFPLENDMPWFFSDEKNFCQDQTHNSQNNRWLAVCPKDVPRGMKGMQVSCNCHGGLRSTEVYTEVVQTHVKPWIEEVAAGRPYVWQQGSAPCHTSRKSQKWLSDNFFDFVAPDVWPPNSPDLNPMDYFVWGAVERGTNRTPCKRRVEDVIDAKGEFIE